MFCFSRLPLTLIRRRHAAFTLLELLTVVLLVGGLAGLVLGVGRSVLERGRKARAQTELAAWSVALEEHRAARGDYPASLDSLKSGLPARNDPWGHPYRFAYKSQVPWSNPGYVLFSTGPDGTAGETLRAGGFADVTSAANADNLYAFPP